MPKALCVAHVFVLFHVKQHNDQVQRESGGKIGPLLRTRCGVLVSFILRKLYVWRVEYSFSMCVLQSSRDQ